MPVSECKCLTDDRIPLTGSVWTPGQPVRAAVLLVHGIGEHVQRYAHVAKAFNAKAFAFVGFDQRGHGRSGGRRGYTPSFETLLDDVGVMLQQAREKFPSRPLFLYGHSMGGLLVLDYVLKREADLAGVISSAPALGLGNPPSQWQLFVLRLLMALKLNIPMSNGLDDSLLSRDGSVIEQYRDDPWTHATITPPLALGMVQAGNWCRANARQLELPVLLLHGSADRITSPAATEAFSKEVPGDCVLWLFPDLLHEPHNEPEQQTVISAITEWMEHHC
jgi:alpha-beta hydrolase superfamily lysophospholipase